MSIDETIKETELKEETVQETQESLDVKYFELENKYLRLLAEMENLRKRLQKEKSEAISFAIENTIKDFLPNIDNLENALNHADKASDEVKNWAIGFQMILSQFKESLFNLGIAAFHSLGNQFDPHFHDAVEIIETKDHLDGAIIEELSKGYKSPNRTIRPARVKVAKQPKEEDSSSEIKS